MGSTFFAIYIKFCYNIVAFGTVEFLLLFLVVWLMAEEKIDGEHLIGFSFCLGK
jgi:hypothetical protein